MKLRLDEPFRLDDMFGINAGCFRLMPLTFGFPLFSEANAGVGVARERTYNDNLTFDSLSVKV